MESISNLRNDLSKGKISRVKITNYRKDGTTFQNLVSMCPVYDVDSIYRFVIGVQFEVSNDADFSRRLGQLSGLLQLLPSSIPLRSKATARANGESGDKQNTHNKHNNHNNKTELNK